MGFSRQEYWSGLPFPSPGDLPDPGIETRSPAFQADALTSEPPGKPKCKTRYYKTPRGKHRQNTLWHESQQYFLGSVSSGQKKKKAKTNKWDLIKLRSFLHSKGNHIQNKRTTYWTRENFCKGYYWQGLNIQFLQNTSGFPHSSVGKESACNAGNPGSIPGSGRSAGEGIGYPPQYSWASLVWLSW